MALSRFAKLGSKQMNRARIIHLSTLPSELFRTDLLASSKRFPLDLASKPIILPSTRQEWLHPLAWIFWNRLNGCSAGPHINALDSKGCGFIGLALSDP